MLYLSNGNGLEPEFGILKADAIDECEEDLRSFVIGARWTCERRSPYLAGGVKRITDVSIMSGGGRGHLITHREFEPFDIPGFISEVIETDEKVSCVRGWWVLKRLLAQKSGGHSGPCQDGGAGAKTSARFWLAGP